MSSASLSHPKEQQQQQQEQQNQQQQQQQQQQPPSSTSKDNNNSTDHEHKSNQSEEKDVIHKTVINVIGKVPKNTKTKTRPTVSEVENLFKQSQPKIEHLGDDKTTAAFVDRNSREVNPGVNEVSRADTKTKGSDSTQHIGGGKVEQMTELSSTLRQADETSHMMSSVVSACDSDETLTALTSNGRPFSKTAGTANTQNDFTKTPNRIHSSDNVNSRKDSIASIDLDSLNTIKEFDLVIDAIDSDTTFSDINTTTHSSDFVEHKPASEADDNKDKEMSATVQNHDQDDKFPPPVAPKRTRSRRFKDQHPVLGLSQNLGQDKSDEDVNHDQDGQTASLQQPQLLTSDSTTHPSSPREPTRNETSAEIMSSHTKPKTLRRPLSEIFSTPPLSVLGNDAEASSSSQKSSIDCEPPSHRASTGSESTVQNSPVGVSTATKSEPSASNDDKFAEEIFTGSKKCPKPSGTATSDSPLSSSEQGRGQSQEEQDVLSNWHHQPLTSDDKNLRQHENEYKPVSKDRSENKTEAPTYTSTHNETPTSESNRKEPTVTNPPTNNNTPDDINKETPRVTETPENNQDPKTPPNKEAQQNRNHPNAITEAEDTNDDHPDAQNDPDVQNDPDEQNDQNTGITDTETDQLTCYNHSQTLPLRYCNDHDQAVCMECAFELHRTCKDVENLQTAAEGRRKELEQLCDAMLILKTDWDCVLTEVSKVHSRLTEDKAETLDNIKKLSDQAIQVIKAKEAELVNEAESLYANEEAKSTKCEERMRRALTSLQEVQTQGEQVLASGSEGRLLRQFGKLKGRFEALAETDVMDSSDVYDGFKVTTTWFDDVKLLAHPSFTLEKRPATSKKNMQLSERGLETFKKISKKRRQNLLAPDMYSKNVRRRDSSTTANSNTTTTIATSPYRSAAARASRLSLARSIASTGSLPSIVSAQSGSFLEGPQSMFEIFAGLESDKYPFGLGDICVMQPRLTILITYLTSDLLRAFPWRKDLSSFVSQPLGYTLCCMTQLTTETVAVTSSNSDHLSFMKVDSTSIQLTHAVPMKRQYRAVTALDYRTLALATDSKKWTNNIIVIVRFDSSDYKSFTLLKTIGARQGSVPFINKLLGKTLFKVPYSMCTASNGDVIVSDSENKAMLALQQDGVKRYVFQPPKHTRLVDTPGGVTCSPSGYLYLVDSCEQRILRFDRSGKFRKVVLSQEDGLEWPIGVAVADDSTLCVAEFYGQVKIFRMR